MSVPQGVDYEKHWERMSGCPDLYPKGRNIMLRIEQGKNRTSLYEVPPYKVLVVAGLNYSQDCFCSSNGPFLALVVLHIDFSVRGI